MFFKFKKYFYIFLDSNLKVYGASNLTGNKEEIASSFDGSRDIMIPSGIMEQYVNYYSYKEK